MLRQGLLSRRCQLLDVDGWLVYGAKRRQRNTKASLKLSHFSWSKSEIGGRQREKCRAKLLINLFIKTIKTSLSWLQRIIRYHRRFMFTAARLDRHVSDIIGYRDCNFINVFMAWRGLKSIERKVSNFTHIVPFATVMLRLLRIWFGFDFGP